MTNYQQYDATGLADLVRRGEVTAGELLDTALARTEAVNGKINAITLLAADTARRKITEGLPEGPLTGVPFLLKDLGAEAVDYPTNMGSRLMAGTRYKRDSEIYRRLAASGVVVFGRTNSPEGGVGPATEARVYGGPTRNPWNLDRTPGGSSGGSGAAVAAGIVPAAHGSDGGGSVRMPASNCGLFGFKATRARFPDGPDAGEGWAGMAIDGWLTRSVRDTALLNDLCQGPDLGAPYWAPPLKGTFLEATRRSPGRLRIALCDTSFDGAAIAPECRDAVHDVAQLLVDMGHIVEPARPSEADTTGMMRAWTDIVACGAASWITRRVEARGRPLEPDEIEPVHQGALAHAATLSGARYLDCVNEVHAYGRQLAAFMLDWDILLTPTIAEPPARIGRFNHDTPDYVGYRIGPQGVFAYSPYCAAFNASGQPAASVPLCWTEDGLPIGIHLAAKFGADELLMSLCADLERARPWFDRRPPAL